METIYYIKKVFHKYDEYISYFHLIVVVVVVHNGTFKVSPISAVLTQKFS